MMTEDIRVQMALDDLDSDDKDERIEAMETLGQSQYKPAIPQLAANLRDADGEVRAAALAALAEMGGIAVVPSLFNLLRDDLPDKEGVIQLGEAIIERFGREVHDGIAAKLAAAVMQVTICQRYLERDPSRIPEELDQLKDLTSQASQEVRAIITNLRAVKPADDAGQG